MADIQTATPSRRPRPLSPPPTPPALALDDILGRADSVRPLVVPSRGVMQRGDDDPARSRTVQLNGANLLPDAKRAKLSLLQNLTVGGPLPRHSSGSASVPSASARYCDSLHVGRQAKLSRAVGARPRPVRPLGPCGDGRPHGSYRERPAILLVDDDVELCQMMVELLGQHGFCVSTLHDGRSGLGAALKTQWDLVILDVMLPVLDGFDVLRQMRRRTKVPVIMLTARAEARDRVAGLDEGADDYLVKPFAASELLARIRALLRRAGPDRRLCPGASHRRIRSVEAGRRRARSALWHAVIALSESESAILEALMRAAGRAVSRDELAALLYQREATPYERSVDVHVSHLRKKLEPCRQRNHSKRARSRLRASGRNTKPVRSLYVRILLALVGTVLASLLAFLAHVFCDDTTGAGAPPPPISGAANRGSGRHLPARRRDGALRVSRQSESDLDGRHALSGRCR